MRKHLDMVGMMAPMKIYIRFRLKYGTDFKRRHVNILKKTLTFYARVLLGKSHT